MKILFVAMAESIHTQRWVSQLRDSGNDVRIYPSIDYGYSHRDLSGVHVYHSFYGRSGNNSHVTKHGIFLWLDSLAALARKILLLITPNYQELYLTRVIQEFRPDLIHSLEMQAGGSLVYKVKQDYPELPTWIVTNWGSDIYLFGQNKQQAKIIRQILESCDYYMCECNRDINLARKFGFKGKVLSVLPNAGGYDLKDILKYGNTLPSTRKNIMLKGYQGWAGRSILGLEALERLGKSLNKGGYGLILYSTQGNIEVEAKARKICKEFDIPIRILANDTSQMEIMKAHGLSRISIGLSLGDGISTSLLESMLVGSFPIQSYTSCADEWLLDGVSGILVSPENVMAVAEAISHAINNNKLVNKAAILNQRTIKKRANYDLVRKKVVAMYNNVLKAI